MKRQRLEWLPLYSLVEDYSIYPRTSIDSFLISGYLENREAGAVFPPIIVDAETRAIVDGFNRVRMEKRFVEQRGTPRDKAKILCDVRRYKSKADMLKDAILANSTHGKPLDKSDRVHAALLGRQVKLDDKTIADLLKIGLKQFLELLDSRTGHVKGHPAPPIGIKGTIKHMAGKALTPKQVEANAKLGGMSQTWMIRQVIILLEDDLLDCENEQVMSELGRLHKLIHEKT